MVRGRPYKNYGAYGRYKIIDGKRFSFRGIYYFKRPAEIAAKDYRRKGHFARIISTKDGGISIYRVYVK